MIREEDQEAFSAWVEEMEAEGWSDLPDFDDPRIDGKPVGRR